MPVLTGSPRGREATSWGKATLAYGFKARSQRIAAEQRALLGRAPHERLDPRALVDHHAVVLRTPADLASLAAEDLEELLERHPRLWSAVSVTLPGGTLVVYNPTHAGSRVNLTICHELSHLILGHDRGRMLTFSDCAMRAYDARQEAEADWLAGSLLAPEAALKRAKFAGLSHAQTARRLGASEDLVRWRWNVSGIDRYLTPRRAAG